MISHHLGATSHIQTHINHPDGKLQLLFVIFTQALEEALQVCKKGLSNFLFC